MRVLLGLFFTTAAVVFMMFSIIPAVIPDSQAVLDILERFYCDNPGDQLSAEQIITHDSDGTGYSADYTCMGRDERPYNVTGKAIVLTIIGFTVPLLLGIFFFISAGSRLNRQIQPQVLQTYPSLGQIEAIGASPDLPARLQQLKDAYDQNLMTTDEYNRKREELLRDFK